MHDDGEQLVQTVRIQSSIYCVEKPQLEREGNTVSEFEDTCDNAAMVGVVGAFTEIRTLILDFLKSPDYVICILPDSADEPPIALSSCTEVESLVLRNFAGRSHSSLSFMSENITNCIDIPSIVSLTVLDHFPGVGTMQINSLIKECASHMRKFTFEVDRHVARDYALPNTDILGTQR